MTRAQEKWLKILREEGFVERGYRFGGSQKNRPLDRLVELGLARHGWGPNGSFLKTQGYFPQEAD